MFLNPIMLAGVGGAVVPLVLHFLARSRFRTVDWGGMMFLAEPRSRAPSGASIRQWTLLLLRMAIVGLLATALARPVVAGWWGDADAGRLIVLVVDASASMGVEEAGGRPRIELAREAALRVLSRAQKGDSAIVVVTGDASAPGPVEDAKAAIDRVTQLKCGAGAADVAGALNTALDLCEQADQRQASPAAKEIYLVCDRQARSWDGVGDAFAMNWKARRSTARRVGHLYLVPVGGELAENVGVEAADVADVPLVAGQPTGVEVRVRNYGTQARTGVPVAVSLGAETLYSTTLNIEPGAVETVRATVRFPQAGPRLLSATVTANDMAADNRLDIAADVRPALKVLIVGAGDSPYLKLALAPFAGTAVGPNLAGVTTASPDEPNLAFAGEDAVVLAGVPRLPDAVATRLEQFVYAGGGLVIAPGAGTQLGEYRRLLYRNGAGLMPADVGGTTLQDAVPTSLLGVTLDHPVFRFLRAGQSPVPAVSVGRYFRADPREGDARVLATYATGDPFLVEGTFGRGRVLLLTTPLDGTWSDLPLTSFYLPFVQSCVRYVTAASPPARVVTVGESVALPVDAQAATVRVVAPDGRAWEQQPGGAAGDPGRREVRIVRTGVPGRYSVAYDAGGSAKREMTFVARAPVTESDLTPLTGESWERVRRSIGFEELPAGGGGPGVLAAFGRIGSELWLPLVAAVLGLILLEGALSRAWSEGVP